MVTIKQLANLRPCSSTHQPKVRGRRGASPLTTIKKYLLKKVDIQDPITHEQGKLAIGEVLALQWLVKAFKGDAEAIKDILDRIDGKAPQKFEGEFGTPVHNHILITTPAERKNAIHPETVAV